MGFTVQDFSELKLVSDDLLLMSLFLQSSLFLYSYRNVLKGLGRTVYIYMSAHELELMCI